MAGLYAAWRLLERGVSPDRIRLFEASDRIGGRVLTVRSPNGLTLDIGAHNFSPSHKIVSGLVDRFGLKSVESIGHSPADIVHLRGRSLANAEIARRWFGKPFAYGISGYVQRRGPARILRKALEKIPLDADGKRRLGGRRLAEWALPDALLEVMSAEELRYLADRLIYSFWHKPVQAEAALSWTAREIFRGRTKMAELPNGMTVLPEMLASAIGKFGAEIEPGHRLASVELAGQSDPIALSFETSEGPRRVTACRVILALPRAALGRVQGLATRPEVEALLYALMPQQAVVTALTYAEPWWSRIGIAGGSSTTDLPARHLRHHGAEAWRSAQGAGVLVSYSDGESADFWRGFGEGKGSGWTMADDAVAVELHRQVGKIFKPKMKSLPSPVGAITQHWNENGAGAAFHLWAAGSHPEISMNNAFCPFEGQKLHICGEAWSMCQGWIEGALETTDLVISRHFGAGQA